MSETQLESEQRILENIRDMRLDFPRVDWIKSAEFEDGELWVTEMGGAEFSVEVSARVRCEEKL